MRRAIILHNPGAGDEDHLTSELTNAIGDAGLEYEYFSIKKDDKWKTAVRSADLAVIAGGDGTVRRVAGELRNGTPPGREIPIGLLPMGTANNLSKALGIDDTRTIAEHVRYWKNASRQVFDIGMVTATGAFAVPVHSAEPTDFFLESIGYGLFPLLMHRMKEPAMSANIQTNDALRIALEVLRELVLSIPSEQYRLEIDGKIHTGSSLLLEVMNIRSIGPNLLLAPDVRTDDGLLDIVCLEENQRSRFAEYIGQLLTGVKAPFGGCLVRYRGSHIQIESDHELSHIDDELLQPAVSSVFVKPEKMALTFLV